MKKTGIVFAIGCCFTTCASSFAGELQVRAPVTRVEPMLAEGTRIEHCAPRPDTRAGLSAMLRWDLGLSCEVEHLPSTEVTGYRVFYQWDERTYSQIMQRDPGSSITLEVRLD